MTTPCSTKKWCRCCVAFQTDGTVRKYEVFRDMPGPTMQQYYAKRYMFGVADMSQGTVVRATFKDMPQFSKSVIIMFLSIG